MRYINSNYYDNHNKNDNDGDGDEDIIDDYGNNDTNNNSN